MGRRARGFYKKGGRTRPITGRKPHKMTTDELRQQVAKMQRRGIVTQVRELKTTVPEASTRFQLQLEFAARRELAMKKRQLKRKARKGLITEFNKLKRFL